MADESQAGEPAPTGSAFRRSGRNRRRTGIARAVGDRPKRIEERLFDLEQRIELLRARELLGATRPFGKINRPRARGLAGGSPGGGERRIELVTPGAFFRTHHEFFRERAGSEILRARAAQLRDEFLHG